jgi:hypothetical protein
MQDIASPHVVPPTIHKPIPTTIENKFFIESVSDEERDNPRFGNVLGIDRDNL